MVRTAATWIAADDAHDNAGDAAAWLAALRAGEPDALATLHRRYLEAIHAYCLRRLGHAEDAEDVTCEVFAEAARAVRRYRGQAGVYAWLLGITRRQVAAFTRRRARRGEPAENDPAALAELPGGDSDAAAVFVERGEVQRAVRRALATLPALEREALMLQAAEGLNLKAIGAVLGRGDNAVKCLLRRARARLRQRLEADAAWVAGSDS